MAEHVDGLEVKMGAGEADQALVPAAPQQTLAPRADTINRSFAGLMPTTLGEAMQLASWLAQSQAVPTTLRKAESVLAVMMAGLEIGLPPMRAVQQIVNIKGRLTMAADLQLALVRRSNVLDIFAESYEELGRTDVNLRKRLDLQLAKADPVQVELVFEQIQAAIQDMPKGKPYAWSVGRRRGEENLHLRTFTWLDAERAFTYEGDEDNPQAGKAKKKLSEKFNYLSWPGDMYPKRSRTRLFQTLASDVTGGLTSTEALEGGQDGGVVDAEVVVHDGEAEIMATIQQLDAALAQGIEQGFSQLATGAARKLQLLRQYQDDPKALLIWLRDEYAKRHQPKEQVLAREQQRAAEQPPKNKGGRPRKVQPAAASHPVQQPAAAEPATQAEPEPQQEPKQEQKPEPKPDQAPGVKDSLQDMARQFRRPTGGGSF